MLPDVIPKELKNASLEKLSKVPGISKETAKQIFNFYFTGDQ